MAAASKLPLTMSSAAWLRTVTATAALVPTLFDGS